MRKAFRHTGVLMMLAVVALGLVGAAYTLWYEKLTMETIVSTANLDAEWSVHNWNGTSFDGTAASSGVANGQPVVHVATATETFLNGGVAGALSGGYMGGKTTAASYNLFKESNFLDGKLKPTCTVGNNTSTDTPTFTMDNLYPWAGCEFQIDLHSGGNVPFHMAIADTKLEQWNGSSWVTPAAPRQNANPWTRGFPSTDGDAVYTHTTPTQEDQCFDLFSADWKGTRPALIPNIQVHPGTDLVCNFKLILDENWFDDSGSANWGNPNHWISNEGLKFRFTVKYVAYQWNETPSNAVLSALP
ncbi:MAG: hypothetical protein LC118_04705 [Dehalococcoidia bacterium]|nr:hypothetical protein [Dehalococcoidia bacterium]